MTDEMVAEEIKRWTGKTPEELGEGIRAAAKAVEEFGQALRKAMEQRNPPRR